MRVVTTINPELACCPTCNRHLVQDNHGALYCNVCGECFEVRRAALPAYADEVQGVCYMVDGDEGASLRVEFNHRIVTLSLQEVKALRNALNNVIDTAEGR